MRRVRIFISSPSDVMAERQRAERVAERLSGLYGDAVQIETIRWEHAYYRADSTFQKQIIDPGECDLVVSIFWSRLGAELPPEFGRMADGRPYPSGSAYEVAQALEARRKRTEAGDAAPLPDVLVYRKTAPCAAPTDDLERRRLADEEFKRLEGFWREWFITREGHFKAGFHKFTSTDQFEQQFESHLRQWLADQDIFAREVAWDVNERGSPFRGLDVFEPAHAAVFFGRGRVIEQARERLTDAAQAGDAGDAFLLIVGESGTGKSSMARAGLIPRLTTPGVMPGVDLWRVAMMTPSDGPNPVAGLAAALFAPGALPELAAGDFANPAELATHLSGGGSVTPVLRALDRAAEAHRRAEGFDRDVAARLVLLVDQLEQTFARDIDAGQRAAFAAALAALALDARVFVIATLRSDTYGQLLREPALLRLKDRGATLDLSPPSPAEVAEIVRGPATAAGLTYERRGGEQLDDVLVEASRLASDALPLLQFTLQRLFEQRRRGGADSSGAGVMTFEAYEALGGLEGAIGRGAAQAYASASKPAQASLPRLIRCLAQPAAGAGPGGSAMALRTASLPEAAVDAPSRELVDALVDARVLVLDASGEAPTVRLAHEAVLRAWDRARDVVAQHATFLRVREELVEAHARWQARGRREPALLLPPGLPLAEAEAAVAQFGEELPRDLRDYVAASGARARRRQRLAYAAAAVFALLFAGAAVTGVVAWRAEQRAASNFGVALQATDNLAIGIAREVERNSEIPTKDKLFFANRMDTSFGNLVQRVGDVRELRGRYGDVLTTNALTLFDAGRYDAATSAADRAHDLLFAGAAAGGEGDGDTPPLTRARAKLARGYARLYAMDFRGGAAALDEADALIAQAGAAANADERRALDRVAARVAVARALLLRMETKYEDAGRAAEVARAALARLLDALPQEPQHDDLRRELLSDYVELHLVRSDLVTAAWIGTSAEVFADLRATLERGRSAYERAAGTRRHLFDACLALEEATVVSQAGQVEQAIELSSTGIDHLFDAARADPQNLKLRYHLGRALLTRANLARHVEDVRQALLDITALRTLTVSLKRDSQNCFLAARLDLMLDPQEASVYLAGRQPKQALAVLAAGAARVELLRRRFVDPTHFEAWNYVLNNTVYQAHLQNKDPRAALDSLRKALEANDAHERRIGASERSASLRYNGHVALLGLDAAVVDAQEWERYFDRATQDVTARLAALQDVTKRKRWLDYQADLYVLRAQRFSRAGAHAEADQWSRRAMDAEAAALALTPTDLDRVDRVITAAWNRILYLCTAENWSGAAAAARAARDAIPSNSSGVRGSSYLVTRWEGFTSMLESRVAAAKKANSASSATATAPAVTAAVSALEREAAVSRRLIPHVRSLCAAAAAAPSPNTAAAATASAGARRELDLRALDLGEVPFHTVEGDAKVLTLSDRLGWRSTPALPGSWRALSKEEFHAAAARFKTIPALRDAGTENAIKRIRQLSLPFYDDGQLYEAEHADATGNSFTAAMLVVNGQTYVLNGTSPPIHEANAKGPVKLRDAAAAAAYLRFFGSYVAGDQGAFRIIETQDELPWSADAPLAQRQAVARVLRPLAVWPDPTSAGAWHASASIHYSNALFHALFTIVPGGMVEMLDDVPVATNVMLETPRFTTRGRASRRLRRLNLEALGEQPVADEAKALLALAELPEPARPAHHALLAEEAAALTKATSAATRPATRGADQK